MSAHEMPQWLADHVNLFRTAPEQAHYFDDGNTVVPCLLLTTKGRTSGRTISIPLLYGRDGTNYVLVASKMGAPEHPHWYRNLISAPEAEIQVGRELIRVRHRTVTGADRARLWSQMTSVFPDYADYQTKTTRELPVVVLEPVPARPSDWFSNHLELYLTNPEQAHRMTLVSRKDLGPVQTLLLITKGRKSGRSVLSPLIYSDYGDACVVIASKGGAPDHPDWYKNLLATPGCKVQVGTRRFSAKGRAAQGEERTKLWAQMRTLWPPFDEYAARAPHREIPVVVLDPTR